MTRYAAAHPGKLGDALYALPTIRYLYGVHGEKFDFYTSQYCAPLAELFEYQPYIDRVILSDDYRPENFGCGAQPWEVPVPPGYQQVYQLGFRRTPDTMLHQFIAKEAGVSSPLAIRYAYPDCSVALPDEFVTIAPRCSSSYDAIFDGLAATMQTVTIGGQGDYRNNGSVDMTGHNLLITASILSRAKAFVGLMSSQLALANGFDIPRIALGGHHSDMRHAVKYHLNHYPGDNVTVQDILQLIG